MQQLLPLLLHGRLHKNFYKVRKDIGDLFSGNIFLGFAMFSILLLIHVLSFQLVSNTPSSLLDTLPDML